MTREIERGRIEVNEIGREVSERGQKVEEANCIYIYISVKSLYIIHMHLYIWQTR